MLISAQSDSDCTLPTVMPQNNKLVSCERKYYTNCKLQTIVTLMTSFRDVSDTDMMHSVTPRCEAGRGHTKEILYWIKGILLDIYFLKIDECYWVQPGHILTTIGIFNL